MILLNKTYDIVTPESAEHGDYAEAGFDFKDVAHSFREVVEFLKGGEASSWPASGSIHEWVTFHEVQDFRDGSEKSTSYHFSRSNPKSKEKYWHRAFLAAGLLPTHNFKSPKKYA